MVHIKKKIFKNKAEYTYLVAPNKKQPKYHQHIEWVHKG